MNAHILQPVTSALAMGMALCYALTYSTPVTGQERLDPQVAKILQERLAELQEAATLTRAAYQQGEQNLTRVLAADQQVLEAQIVLAPNQAERLKVRQAMLKNAETLEQVVEALFKSAETPRADLLNAKAYRLRMQADLLTEQISLMR